MPHQSATEVARRIEDLRAYAAKERRAVTPFMVIAALLYAGSAVLGNGAIGWAMFVAAVAISFYIVVISVVVCQQSAIAELLERTVLPTTHTEQK